MAELQRQARESHPGVLASSAKVEAAIESQSRARALPDPGVGVMVAVEEVQTRVGPQEARISLEQRLPARGKREAREEAMQARSDRARARLATQIARLDADVARAFYALYRLEQGLRITRDSRDLLVYLEGVVRNAYESGGATYADLIRVQVEIGRLENDLRTREDALEPARADLNALLDREPDAPLPQPAIPGRTPRLLDVEVLRARMHASSPALAEARAEVAERGRETRQVDLERRPDWTVGLDWIVTGEAMNPGVRGSGDDAVMIGVRTSVPWARGRYRSASREARVRRDAAERDGEAVRNDLDRSLARLVFEFRDADREVRLYRDTLLPKARQSLQASESGFRAGTVAVSDLVEAQQVLLQFELAIEEARARREISLAELRATVGDEILDGGPVDAEGEATS